MMQIIDAHHHLWDLNACYYPWLAAKGVKRFFGDPAPIQKNYLVDDYRRDAQGFELLGSVHVQVGVDEKDSLRESEWLSDTRNETGLPSAIVAYCDLAAGDVAVQLERQLDVPGVRGIRQIVGRSDAEDAVSGTGTLLTNPAFADGLHLLAERDASFDLQLTPRQLPAAAELISGVNALRVALCHCGSPWDQSPAGLADWRRGLTLLAEIPSVYCKISGLGMFDHGWGADSIRPLVESCIAIFGAERCMFGSNFPVDKLHADWATVWNAFDEITTGMLPADRDQLFRKSASEFYSLGID